MGPQEQGGPDSLLDAIVGFIDSAKARQKLKIAVQEIDNEDIARAIVRARKRRVVVDLVLEQSYLLETKAPDDPFKAQGLMKSTELCTTQSCGLRLTLKVTSILRSSIKNS